MLAKNSSQPKYQPDKNCINRVETKTCMNTIIHLNIKTLAGKQQIRGLISLTRSDVKL